MGGLSGWEEIVNMQLVDHEQRLRRIEEAAAAINMDDAEYTWPPGDLSPAPHYDLRTPEMRRDARLNNHDQRLRALEHRLMMLELQVASNAASSADGV